VIVNTHETLPGEFTRNIDYRLPSERIKQQLQAASGEQSVVFVDATLMAEKLVGHSLGANMILLGMAFQFGLIPLATASIEKAIRLNGEAVEANLAAFRWGRRLGQDQARAETFALPSIALSRENKLSTTLEEKIERRFAYLKEYQNAAYARRYSEFIEKVRRAEDRVIPKNYGLTGAVAAGLFKLMAYKDEYEVARLFTDDSFGEQLQRQFENKKFRLRYYLSRPFQQNPLFEKMQPRKKRYGGSTKILFHILARLKFLRGTPFNPFGYQAERRTERRLIAAYEARVDELIAALNQNNHAAAIAIANLPEMIRGFGHVKMKAIEQAGQEEARLLTRFKAGMSPVAELATE
jgi:indolepyruvate ferredoxin oxidoreductase